MKNVETSPAIKGSVVKRFVMWRKLRARKKCIQSLRAHLAFFGCDTSNMTDDEIKEHVLFVGKQMAKTGISAQQAVDGFRFMSRIAGTPDS